MKHFVVTIGGEYGAGGPDIGKIMAETMGVDYYDRDLVDSVVAQIGVDRELVSAADNKNFVPFGIETTLGTRYANLSNKVIYTQFEVIKKMAQSSCIIIGRCSDYILRDTPDVVNIFVYAPEEARIAHIQEARNVSRTKAQELIRQADKALHDRYTYITGTYRGDRHNRHLLIDSSVLGWQRSAKLIQAFVEMCFEM
ncbi:MAG: cytidylate kinase-like family protein [Megasphaera sp.]|jgi:cytidylate kinase|nr:cytidylate kinase-like family protein [Megasphaera sp.]